MRDKNREEEELKVKGSMREEDEGKDDSQPGLLGLTKTKTIMLREIKQTLTEIKYEKLILFQLVAKTTFHIFI